LTDYPTLLWTPWHRFELFDASLAALHTPK